MHIDKISEANNKVCLSITNRARDRLMTTCFRPEGRVQNLAGSFSVWDSPENFFQDSLVQDELICHADELAAEAEYGTHSVTLSVFDKWLGWESTDQIERYTDFGILHELEKFNPNRKSNALRFPLRLKYKFKAPATNKVTVVFEFRPDKEDDGFLFIIHSVYPGEDIGELVGNITEREQRVFFDWDHPGEDFPDESPSNL